jgi:hypothetical protein
MTSRYDFSWLPEGEVPNTLELKFMTWSYETVILTLYSKKHSWVHGRVKSTMHLGMVRHVVIEMKNFAGDCFEFDISAWSPELMILNSCIKVEDRDIQQDIAGVMRALGLRP